VSAKKKPAAHARKLQWKTSKLTEGPFAGPVWGARVGEAFLMIVQRAATKKQEAYYELWFAGIVFDETKSATLAEAKAFGERVLRESIDGIAAGLTALSGAHTQKKAA
jgi:hypothetical protein